MGLSTSGPRAGVCTPLLWIVPFLATRKVLEGLGQAQKDRGHRKGKSLGYPAVLNSSFLLSRRRRQGQPSRALGGTEMLCRTHPLYKTFARQVRARWASISSHSDGGLALRVPLMSVVFAACNIS